MAQFSVEIRHPVGSVLAEKQQCSAYKRMKLRISVISHFQLVWFRRVPRGAAALLLGRVRVTFGEGAPAAGVALRLDEDAAGGGSSMASGREAGAGGGVVEISLE